MWDRKKQNKTTQQGLLQQTTKTFNPEILALSSSWPVVSSRQPAIFSVFLPSLPSSPLPFRNFRPLPSPTVILRSTYFFSKSLLLTLGFLLRPSYTSWQEQHFPHHASPGNIKAPVQKFSQPNRLENQAPIQHAHIYN